MYNQKQVSSIKRTCNYMKTCKGPESCGWLTPNGIECIYSKKNEDNLLSLKPLVLKRTCTSMKPCKGPESCGWFTHNGDRCLYSKEYKL